MARASSWDGLPGSGFSFHMTSAMSLENRVALEWPWRAAVGSRQRGGLWGNGPELLLALVSGSHQRPRGL